MKVAVFGLGYVGSVTAAVLASNGHDVWGVDVDPGKTALVADGKSPVVEPELEQLLSQGVATGKLKATCDIRAALEGADASLVCVGTPSSPTGGTDLGYILRVVGGIADTLAAGASTPSGRHAVVIRSTVPPGTIDEHVAPLLAARLAQHPLRVGIGVCPEFLREGSAIADFYDSPLSVVGTRHEHVGQTMRELLSFLESPVRVVGPREAEALKYACNAFHATKVSFANELGRIFRLLGCDVRLVMEMFCDDTKLNLSSTYLSPGFAFGGSCLPKDLRSLLYLARMNCIDVPLLAGTMSTNELAINDVINRVLASDARSVALLGLSFKANSDDLRESPYVDLAETLIGKGIDLRIFDPVVDEAVLVGANRQFLVSKLPHVRRVLHPSAADALFGADLALVSSSHPSVKEALVRRPPGKIIDLSGRLGPEVEALPGYEGVAW